MYGKIRVEIPDTCRECRFFVQGIPYMCTAKGVNTVEQKEWLEQNYAGGRPTWCPIKEDRIWQGGSMTRNEMIEFIKENPYVHITHDLFDANEYIYSDIDELIWDESGYLFENWDDTTGTWYGNNGIALRTGGSWENGWHIKERP